jgi:hypothetical protein
MLKENFLPSTEISQQLGVCEVHRTTLVTSSIKELKVCLHRIYPGFPPYRLSEEAMRRLMVRLHLVQDDVDLHLLRQQCILSEAVAAAQRGESLAYLSKL